MQALNLKCHKKIKKLFVKDHNADFSNFDRPEKFQLIHILRIQAWPPYPPTPNKRDHVIMSYHLHISIILNKIPSNEEFNAVYHKKEFRS